MSVETIAGLRIFLADIKPTIWRRVEVPVTASLKMLPNIFQKVGDRRYGVPDPM